MNNQLYFSNQISCADEFNVFDRKNIPKTCTNEAFLQLNIMTTVEIENDGDDFLSGSIDVQMELEDCCGVDENAPEEAPLPDAEHLIKLLNAAEELKLQEPAEIVSDGNEVFLQICKLHDANDAYDWLASFRRVTGIDWNVVTSRSTAIYYVCVHASKYKNRNGPTKHPEWSKDRNCPAKLRINFKKPHSEVSTATVSVHHSHGQTLQQLSQRKNAPDTRERFMSLFANNCTPSVAKKENFRYVHANFGDSAVYDAALCPTSNQIYHLWRTFVKTSAGGNSWAEVLAKIRSDEEQYSKSGFRILVSEEPLVITIISPIMERVQQMPEAAEMAFIDTTSNCDLFGAFVTPILVRTAAGAFPISVSISENITAASYGVMLQQTASIPNSYCGQGYPNVCMRDDDSAIAAALRSVCPRTLQLVCTYHSLNSHWRFVMSEFSAEADRQTAFRILRDVNCNAVAAETEAMCLKAQEHPLALRSKGFRKRIQTMQDNKESYIWAFRPPTIRGTHTNNYAEAQMLVIKDGALGRCKALNPFALLNYIAVEYEQCHQTRLVEFSRAGDHRPFNKVKGLQARARVQKDNEI